MRQSLPAAANSDHLAADFTPTVNYRLDYGIQSRDVAATRENADTLRSHEYSSTLIRLENLIIEDGMRIRRAGVHLPCRIRRLRGDAIGGSQRRIQRPANLPGFERSAT